MTRLKFLGTLFAAPLALLGVKLGAKPKMPSFTMEIGDANDPDRFPGPDGLTSSPPYMPKMPRGIFSFRLKDFK